MLTFVKGNLFHSPAKVLVNTVNTVGVMGKGIALTFKDVYPEMFRRYVEICETKQLDIGKLWLYKTEHKWVLNFPTKKHWRQPSRLEYIEAGLQKFVASYAREKITSIAFPELGCGNGELDWNDVRPMMIHYLGGLSINVFIYLYDRTQALPVEHQDIGAMRKWLRSEPRTLAFGEFWNDLKEVVGEELTLTRLNSNDRFTVRTVTYDSQGLLLHLGDRTPFQAFRDDVRDMVNTVLHTWRFVSKNRRTIFIPDETLLELWQSIRFYGFCFARTMPGGLDTISDYLMPLLARLAYLRPASIGSPTDSQVPKLENALQLYIPESVGEPSKERVKVVAA